MSTRTPRLIMTIGIPACGKTTWAREQMAQAEDGTVLVLERDVLRRFHCEDFDLNNYKFSKRIESAVSLQQFKQARYGLEYGMTVIFADTNLNPSTRVKIRKLAEEFDIVCEEEVFTTPLEVCVKRNLKRRDTVPNNVLITMQRRLRAYVGVYTQSTFKERHLPECVIYDIDGTLANHIGIRNPHDLDKVSMDTVHQDVARMIWDDQMRDTKVFIFSGRNETCREDTEKWLYTHNIPYDELHMRPDITDENGNHPADYVVKGDMFDNVIKGKYRCTKVVDDRAMMCRYWESLELRVINVGGFSAEF